MRVWREYFRKWVAVPDPMAQMLASVMFDLRPIGGTASLFTDLQAEMLEMAAKNSIFVAHMIANSLKHTPPLGLLRGFATIRSGEHKNHIDLKMNGVVPVVDLGRIYALIGAVADGQHPRPAGGGGRGGGDLALGRADLIEAYDLIAETRLEHQARRVQAGEQARQLHRALGTVGFRTQPPARRLCRRAHHAIRRRDPPAAQGAEANGP